MAKCNHCYILKGNNIKTNNEKICMTFFFKGKSLSKIRVKRKLNKTTVKKKNSMNCEDDEYSQLIRTLKLETIFFNSLETPGS